MNTSGEIEIIRYDAPRPYLDAYEAQLQRRNALEQGTGGEVLFLLEHTPVFTLGRSAHEEHLLRSREALAAMGIEVCEVDRGGDVTYHGPGQLVAYPILDLSPRRLSIQGYLRRLEQIIIDLLADYGLQAGREEGYTGVWVQGAKVAAIGVGVHNGVTFHGVAVNVDPVMEHFRLIVPCGIPNKPVTSLKQLLGEAPPLSEVADRFARHLTDALGLKPAHDTIARQDQ